MSEESPNKTKIIASLQNRSGQGRKNRTTTRSGKVLSGVRTKFDPTVVRVIGGDTDDFEQNLPPAIVIEKRLDRISKIIVKCPCGRHAELVCEYTDES
jgi:hypothetical protein